MGLFHVAQPPLDARHVVDILVEDLGEQSEFRCVHPVVVRPQPLDQHRGRTLLAVFDSREVHTLVDALIRIATIGTEAIHDLTERAPGMEIRKIAELTGKFSIASDLFSIRLPRPRSG